MPNGKSPRVGTPSLENPGSFTGKRLLDMSHVTYACKTEGENGISSLISALCVNCLSSILEYSRLNHLDVYLV